MIGIHDLIRITLATDNPDLNKALEVVRSTPGWEQKVREWFSQDKKAGLGKGLAIPLSVALLTLSQAWGADTADQFISKAKTVIEKEAPKVDSALIDQMAEMLPYPVNIVELGLLASGSITQPKFESSLREKIENGLKVVVPKIDKDAQLSKLDTAGLSDLITKALIKKIDSPKNARAKKILMGYLGENGMKIIEDIARATVSESSLVGRRQKRPDRPQV